MDGWNAEADDYHSWSVDGHVNYFIPLLMHREQGDGDEGG